MNNIEKLAIEHGARYLDEESKLMLVISGELLEALVTHQAKALQQSSEPVATLTINDKYEYSLKLQETNSLDAYIHLAQKIGIGNHQLFTLPPSTISLDEHNKRIAELEEAFEIVKKQHIHALNSVIEARATNKKLLEWVKQLGHEAERRGINLTIGGKDFRQAIADAEGVER